MLGKKFERAEMQIIRSMCVVSMKDRRTSEELSIMAGVDPITTGRLRWYGHVMSKKLSEKIYGVESRRPRKISMLGVKRNKML